MKLSTLFVFVPLLSFSQKFSSKEIQRYREQAQRVTIIRDTWGVPHIYGKTDADVVFGLLYAQCEENYQKVEENNLEVMGRLSEIDGKEQLYNDLQMRLIYDSIAAIDDYHHSPAWLKKLCDAAADGVNYFLYKHPLIKHLLLHYEPWFALLRTNGSISATQNGGINLNDIKNLYPAKDNSTGYLFKHVPVINEEPPGSNGFAVAPSKTFNHNAILYINPHVTFYFRTEVEMVSEEGLNAYGAVTWGTFFIFQGFNQYCGWMHTSGAADVADLFKEMVVMHGDSLFTKYDDTLKPVITKQVIIKYKTNNGLAEEHFTAYHTIHGPVMGKRDSTWLSLREKNRSMGALMQSWLRTKARGFKDFKKVMNLRSNTSDNTVFADNKGNIAYWHGNFIPKRNNHFDYSHPVDGSTSLSDWKSIYDLDSIVHVFNPATGFIQNCNSTPFTVSGSSSPHKENYPEYMAPDGENYRALNAANLLSQANNLTVDKMIHNIGYNHHLAAFDLIVPALLNDYDQLPSTDSLKKLLFSAIEVLRAWDKNSSGTSVATTLAIEFGYRLMQKIIPAANRFKANNMVMQFQNVLLTTTSAQRLNLLQQTLEDLIKRFGTYKISWGTENCYQRSGDGKYNDSVAGMAVGLGPGVFGSLPSFASKRFANTNKRYGFSGNSFIACVEFGKRVKAKSIVTGGQSFDPASKHFTDQARMFIAGNFKDVLFYKEDVLRHVEKRYKPGE